METHSSVLAWRIPWKEEPGRLQSMGSERVGHSFHFLPPVSWVALKTPCCRRVTA